MKQIHDATEDIEIIKRHLKRAWNKAYTVSEVWTNQKQRILVNDLMGICETAFTRLGQEE